MPCEEKARLLAEYEKTTKDFAESITELQRATDEARLKSEQARLALERHVVAHGC